VSDVGVTPHSHSHQLPVQLRVVEAAPPARSEAEAADLSFRALRAVILAAAWHWVFVSALLGVVRGFSAVAWGGIAFAGAMYCLGALRWLDRSHRRRMIAEFETVDRPRRRLPLPVKLRIPLLTLTLSEVAALAFLLSAGGH
jgi:hypothetical protein